MTGKQADCVAGEVLQGEIGRCVNEVQQLPTNSSSRQHCQSVIVIQSLHFTLLTLVVAYLECAKGGLGLWGQSPRRGVPQKLTLFCY